MHWKSVNARFLIILIPLFIVSYLLISIVTYHYSREELINNAHLISRSIASEVALRTQLYVKAIELPLNVAAGFLTQYHKEGDSLIPTLKRLKNSTEIINQSFFIDKKGMMLRSDGKVLNRGSRFYVQHVFKTHKPYVSRPFVGETTKTIQTMILYPVFNKAGEFNGILGTSIHLDKLIKNIFSEKIPYVDSLFIIDERGYIVGGSEDGEVKINNTLLSEFFGSNLKPNVKLLKLDSHIIETIRHSFETKEQSIITFYSPDKKEQIATITPFDISGNSWSIISAIEKDKIMSPINKLLKILICIFFCFVLIAFIIIIFFAKSISLPLQMIANKIKTMHGTDLNTISDDEIAILKKGFSEMKYLQDKSRKFEHEASYDKLTGLLNRAGFERVSREILHKNHGKLATLLFADLDHLKDINDTFGHGCGDSAIKEAASLLLTSLGDESCIARIGGDEFVALVVKDQKLFDCPKRLSERVAKFNQESGLPYYVELSTGSIEFTCSKDTDIDGLLSRADEFLYMSKGTRRPSSIR